MDNEGRFDFADVKITSPGHAVDPNNPVVRAIVFSRHFVPTYYLCLAIVVVTASISRYGSQLSKERSSREKATQLDRSSSPSSSASTLQGEISSPDKDDIVNERTSLLDTDPTLKNDRPVFYRYLSYFRSFLIYQPHPIPALTTSANHLPSNGTTVMILLILAINIFYLLYKNVPWKTRAQPFADRAGLCFVANLPVLYLLGAKNNKPLKWLTGWSYEGLNIVHRRLGEWMILLACLHAIGMFTLWYTVFMPIGFGLGRFLSIKIVTIGLSAFVAYLTLYTTSTGYFRRSCYEAFLASHISLQAAALVLVFLHHHNTRWYCGVALAIWTSDRIITRILVSSRSFVTTLQVAPDGETVLLFFDIPLTQSKHHGIRSGWQAGQHVFITVPGIGLGHRLQAHPFTIASPAPPSHLRSGIWPLQLIIKGKDGFSQELLQYAKFHQHARVIVDGPYGSTEVLDALKHADRTCLIAGGTGISVTYPMSWNILVENATDSILSTRTIYSSGRKTIPKFSLSSSGLVERKHAHFWVRQQSNHGKWITMLPKRNAITGATFNQDQDRGLEGVDLLNRIFTTRDTLDGRPDIALELREWLQPKSWLVDHEQRIVIVVSGPEELARNVRNCVSRLVREGYNIEIFVEKFGW